MKYLLSPRKITQFSEGISLMKEAVREQKS